MRECGILPIILPELAAGGDQIDQRGMHHEDVLSHAISTCKASVALSDCLEVRLASLFHDIGKSEVMEEGEERNTFYNHDLVGEKLTIKVMRRLKASNEQTRLVSLLVRIICSVTRATGVTAQSGVFSPVWARNMWGGCSSA